MALPAFMVEQLLSKAEPKIKLAAGRIVRIASGGAYFRREPENREALEQEIANTIRSAIEAFAKE